MYFVPGLIVCSTVWLFSRFLKLKKKYYAGTSFYSSGNIIFILTELYWPEPMINSIMHLVCCFRRVIKMD